MKQPEAEPAANRVRAKSEFNIDGRVIEADQAQAFIIAEAGVNHNGDPELAQRLVDAAADAGADAVKFQTFAASAVAATDAATSPYQQVAGVGKNQRSMLEQLELPPDTWRELNAHAADRGLVFLSTAFDAMSLELLQHLGVGALKIPSGELTNIPFLEMHATCGLPCIVSTGMATMDEVDEALAVLSTNAVPLALLHCVTAYPTPLDSANLRAIASMLERHQVPVGWSDHTIGSTSAVAARALGAVIFEKHITLDTSMKGPDHAASADPDDFAKYVDTIRACERALGTGEKVPADVELENLQTARRSYFAAADIEQGEALSPQNIVGLRPVRGIPVSHRIYGRFAARRIASGSPIEWSDLV